MPTLKYGRASGRASQGWNNACSVSSRRAHCRSLREDAPQSKVTALEGQSASSVGDCAVIDDANQEQIAKAAALVLERAKAVLNEKLEDYESELQQLETAASRNFVYKCVADTISACSVSQTQRLLTYFQDTTVSTAEVYDVIVQGYECVDNAASSAEERVCQSTNPHNGRACCQRVFLQPGPPVHVHA